MAVVWSTGSAGLTGTVLHRPRELRSRPSEEVFAIENRTWPAMRELGERDLEEVTGPAIEALRALRHLFGLHRENARRCSASAEMSGMTGTVNRLLETGQAEGELTGSKAIALHEHVQLVDRHVLPITVAFELSVVLVHSIGHSS